MEPPLHLLFFGPPLDTQAVLPLFFRFQFHLETFDLGNQVRLVILVRIAVHNHFLACLCNMALKSSSLLLRFIKLVHGDFDIISVVLNELTLAIERKNSCFESLYLNFLIRDLHGHLVLLVLQHLFVVVLDGGSFLW